MVLRRRAFLLESHWKCAQVECALLESPWQVRSLRSRRGCAAARDQQHAGMSLLSHRSKNIQKNTCSSLSQKEVHG